MPFHAFRWKGWLDGKNVKADRSWSECSAHGTGAGWVLGRNVLDLFYLLNCNGTSCRRKGRKTINTPGAGKWEGGWLCLSVRVIWISLCHTVCKSIDEREHQIKIKKMSQQMTEWFPETRTNISWENGWMETVEFCKFSTKDRVTTDDDEGIRAAKCQFQILCKYGETRLAFFFFFNCSHWNYVQKRSNWFLTERAQTEDTFSVGIFLWIFLQTQLLMRILPHWQS